MIPPEAINQFTDRQKRLLVDTYNNAWQEGVGGYEPDDDPEEEPDTDRDAALAGLTGAALLAARRAYRYVAPTSPDPVRRAVALAPAFQGVNKMAGELATLAPATDAQGALADAGAAFHQGVLDWLDNNAWRLDPGASVAWAGEQNGYGEAADQDGQLLEWQTEDDDHVCPDCETLGGMDPQPLSEWPCQPGDGATQCNVGCRCSLAAYPVSIQPNDTYAPQLSSDQEALVGNLMTAQANQLNSMMPDAAYLN